MNSMEESENVENHPVKNSLNFCHPSVGVGASSVVISGVCLLIVFNQTFHNGNYIGHCFIGCI